MTVQRSHASLLIILAFTSFISTTALSQNLERAMPEKVGLSAQRLARLSAVFDGFVKDQKLPGYVLYVARKGKLVYQRSYGFRDKESNAAMTNDVMFRVASQTKALVSVATMILQEEGKLLIGDPVGKYIPQYNETWVAVPKDTSYEVVKAKRKITIRDLLTHTAGIGYGYGPAADKWKAGGIQGWYFANRDEPIAATVERMASLPMDTQPGEKYVYGYSTDILGVVVERASGLPLDEFLRDRLFKPLGMNDTYFYVPGEKRNRLATVYSLEDGGTITRAPDPGEMTGQGMYIDGPRKSFSGGAGIVSTAHDYTVFLQMLLNGGTFNGKRILSRKTVELMTVDHLPPVEWQKGVGFGLGFSVNKDLGMRGTPGTVGEFGWGGAYHSTYWVDPKEELVVVYFTQLIPARGIDDHGKLRALVYQAIVD